jgi:hypothetical protein
MSYSKIKTYLNLRMNIILLMSFNYIYFLQYNNIKTNQYCIYIHQSIPLIHHKIYYNRSEYFYTKKSMVY